MAVADLINFAVCCETGIGRGAYVHIETYVKHIDSVEISLSYSLFVFPDGRIVAVL